ncbi:MAG: hypothetical protein WKF89_16785 [Chitinophagaceae bacterium]
MKQELYEINSTEDLSTYVFLSKGRKGEIVKIVQFTHLRMEVSPDRYNLALGDWIDEKIDAGNITNNGDIKTVMATVGAITLYYTSQFPLREIFVAGSSRNRSRLYQMLVSNNLEEIEKDFDVFGIRYFNNRSDELEGFAKPFQKNETYGAILVIRK